MADLPVLDALAAGRLAAFHGAPLDGVTILTGVDDDEARWLLGVCLGAAGRYGEAMDVLPDVGPGPWASLAASTLGSLHRQLGRHAAAHPHDVRALEAAEDAESSTDALLGLAADAVGIGDVEASASAWQRAYDLDAAGWRPQVRVAWVEAEIALLRGDPGSAVGPALDAAEIAHAVGAPRHQAKSLMFAGVASCEAGDVAGGLNFLRASLTEARVIGALPLVWPVGSYLAARVATADPAGAREAQAAARDAVATIAAGLPPELRASWLALPGVPSP